MFPLLHARFAVKEAEEEGLLSRGMCVCVCLCARARARAYDVHLYGIIEATQRIIYESAILFFLFFYLISQNYA